MASGGLKAISPDQNLGGQSNTIATNQVKTTVPTATGTNPQSGIVSPVTATPPAYSLPGYKSPGQIADDAEMARQKALVNNTQPNNPQSTPQVNQNNTQNNPQNTPQDTSREGLMTGLFNQIQRGQQNSDAAIAYQKQLQTDIGKKDADIIGSGTDLNFKTGQQGALQRLAAIQNSAAQGAVQQTQTQSGQAIGAYNAALGYRQPVSGAAFFGDPNSGQILGGGNGISGAGNTLGRLAMSQALPQQKAVLATTGGLKSSIDSLLKTTNINPSQFTDINSIYQFLNGKVADPKYQALSNSVSQFVQQIAPILGMDVNTIAANIKGNGGNISDTLNNLYQQAQYKVAVNDSTVNGTVMPQAPTNTFGGGSSNGGGSTYTSQGGNSYNLPY